MALESSYSWKLQVRATGPGDRRHMCVSIQETHKISKSQVSQWALLGPEQAKETKTQIIPCIDLCCKHQQREKWPLLWGSLMYRSEKQEDTILIIDLFPLPWVCSPSEGRDGRWEDFWMPGLAPCLVAPAKSGFVSCVIPSRGSALPSSKDMLPQEKLPNMLSDRQITRLN